jgi:hypothetical protein
MSCTSCTGSDGTGPPRHRLCGSMAMCPGWCAQVSQTEGLRASSWAALPPGRRRWRIPRGRRPGSGSNPAG